MTEFINVIVDNGRVWEHDEDLLFGMPDYRRTAGSQVLHIKPGETDMFDLLVHAGVYPNKIIAEMTWKETGSAIPEGYSEFDANGKKIVIWNPAV
jgi:hypothetical protein